jgi:nucleotide-binding universal stress UspA family protein
MLPFRRILFPVDYSPSCRAAAPYVRDMMRHYAANLTLLRAYVSTPWLAAQDPSAAFIYSTPPESLSDSEEQRKAEEGHLRGFAFEMFPDYEVDIAVREDEAGIAIHDHVKHEGTDLVMMPTRDCGMLRRLLMGSVTAKVLHDVSTPVWTGIGAALTDHRPAIPYRSILCAVDENEEGAAVLTAGAAIAKLYDARVAIVHVMEMPVVGMEGVNVEPYMDEIIQASESGLRELKQRVGMDAPHVISTAAVREAIAQQAAATKADLIIVGRGHAQGRLGNVWSRIYSIVRDSPCPVLSI